MVKEKQSRIVLRRSKESRVLRCIGIAVYLFLILLFALSIIFATNEYFWRIVLASLLVAFLRGFFTCVRELFRKVVLLENYISFTGWSLLPRIYTYDQISQVETVLVDEGRWSIEPETYVKVTFEDSRVLKVQKSLMSVREFRKHLSQKAGRRFRKPTKKSK